MRDRTAIRTLAQELENDCRYIQESARLVKKAALRAAGSSWSDDLDLMAVGASRHSLYNTFEASHRIELDFIPVHSNFLAWLDQVARSLPREA